MINAKEDLDFIMQMMVMLDPASGATDEDRVREAFRGLRQRKSTTDLWEPSTTM